MGGLLKNVSRMGIFARRNWSTNIFSGMDPNLSHRAGPASMMNIGK